MLKISPPPPPPPTLREVSATAQLSFNFSFSHSPVSQPEPNCDTESNLFQENQILPRILCHPVFYGVLQEIQQYRKRETTTSFHHNY